MTLYVCVTCRDAAHRPGQEAPCAGARLLAALRAGPADAAVAITPVECLSACRRACSVGFAAPGKWTYVYGDMDEAAAAAILAGARLYAGSAEGLIPWRDRPDILKKGALARVPPAPLP